MTLTARIDESACLAHGDCAVVTGQVRIELVADGKPKTLSSAYTNVWIKGANGWQMVAWQSTPLSA